MAQLAQLVIQVYKVQQVTKELLVQLEQMAQLV
jgi:hypothetical protein